MSKLIILESLYTEKFPKISPHDFDQSNIDETARRIGRLMLDDSEIIRDYLGRRISSAKPLTKGSFRGASPLFTKNSPSPYQGEGDKGDGVT